MSFLRTRSIIVFLVAFAFATGLPWSAVWAQSAPSCAGIWALEASSAPAGSLRVLENVSKPEKPAVVDLERVFTDLDQRIFIGVESWGHVFLQVGRTRLDGHVLSEISFKETNLEMRHGLIVELPAPSAARMKVLQARLRERHGHRSVSCVHEILSLLRQEFGWKPRDREGTIWLSDLAELMTTGGFVAADGKQVPVRVSATKSLDLESFLKRMRSQEQTWRDGTFTKLGQDQPDLPWSSFLEGGAGVPREAVARALKIPLEQVDLLARELARKTATGDHRRTLDSSIDPVLVQRLIVEDVIKTSEQQHQQKARVLESGNRLTEAERARIAPVLGSLRGLISQGRLRSALEALLPLSPGEATALLVAVSRELQPGAISRIVAGRDEPLKPLNKLLRLQDELLAQASESLASPTFEKFKLTPAEVVQAVRFAPPDREGLGLLLGEVAALSPPSKRVFLEQLRDRAIERKRPALVEVRDLDPAKVTPVVRDQAIVREFQGAVERWKRDGHTLRENDYIERHLSPALLAWLHGTPGVRIRVYGSSRTEALASLLKDGFTEIREFAPNEMTDFTKWVARDPRTGETLFAVQTLPGRATVIEALAHFVYHRDSSGQALAMDRVSVFRSRTSIRQGLVEALRGFGFHPDILVFGSVTGLSSQLRTRVDQPIGTLLSEALAGKTAVVGGKRILLVSIEPRLFGDRAGELIHAVRELTGRAPEVLFSGTAGALDPAMRIHDLVLPTEFSLRNHLEELPAPAVRNLAIDRLSAERATTPSLRTGARHAAVDTILFEDKAWFARHGKGPRAAQVVEQELADVARAAHETGAPLSVILRISDELHSGKDFSSTEVHNAAAGAEPGSVVQPSRMLMRVLDSILPSSR